MEVLTRIEAAAQRPPHELAEPLGWPDESWREVAEHSVEHDDVSRPREVHADVHAAFASDRARVITQSAADLDWARRLMAAGHQEIIPAA